MSSSDFDGDFGGDDPGDDGLDPWASDPDPGISHPASVVLEGELPNFDPGTDPAHLIGDPASAMDDWHQQEAPDTCAIVSQEFVLEELTGQEFTEAELVSEATEQGWYVPGGGTPMADVGRVLEAHGVSVERYEGASLEDLQAAVASGQGVIVGVDAQELWTPGGDILNDDLVGDVPGIPGQDANHAVSVIGFDVSDPEHPMVILNDPGHPEGRGLMMPAEEFVGAWNDSGNFMVVAEAKGSGFAPSAAQPMFAGYWNADGTYHWDSDNTDRDPQTGAVVRRW